MLLFRPVGLRELQRIAASGFREFPERLPHQPFFYPVLSEAYAVEIARDWNTKDPVSDHAGFVTRFELDDAFAARHAVHPAGAARHEELWVPAAQLGELNAHIRGRIAVVAAFAGPSFQGEIDAATHLPRALELTDLWSVWRQDDHGSRSEVASGLREHEARDLLASLEARGHRQTYWMERAPVTAPRP
jgi:hypothetical protein